MNYQFHPDAFDEHYDSVAFYQNRLPGLGADYVAEFDAVMALICRTPNFYPTIGEPDIHKAGLKRFPFHVIYRVMPTTNCRACHRAPTPPPGLLGRADSWMMIFPNVGRNNQRALRRMDWCNALCLVRTGRCGAAGDPSASPLRGLHSTGLEA